MTTTLKSPRAASAPCHLSIVKSPTPIRQDLEPWDVIPGATQIDRTGARLAQEMLTELESIDPTGPDVSIANRSMLEDWWPRWRRPVPQHRG